MISQEKIKKYYDMAVYVGESFSKDPSTKVGALLIKPGTMQVLSMGYNGMPRGIDETIPSRWERPIKYSYIEHAERNAIYNACRNGTSLEGSIMFVSAFPCVDCMRGIIQSGVVMLVTSNPSEDLKLRWNASMTISKDMCVEAGIELVMLE